MAEIAGKKVSQDGVLIIEAKRYRTQEQNRLDAELRLVVLIQKALIKPKRRRPTHPSAASQEKRVNTKKRKGKIKQLRNSLYE